MQEKHTPGPWDIGKHATPDYAPQFGIYSGAAARDHVIVKGGNAATDAALIAAAPELLTALQLYLVDCELEKLEHNSDTYNAAREAIAKATGQ